MGLVCSIVISVAVFFFGKILFDENDWKGKK
jgi:hypothetical protein